MKFKELAPIVLFVYKRPEHTKRILNSLAECNLSNECTLIIYADGAKENASQEDLNLINEVRGIIKDIKWCKELRIIERETNVGLDPNVIEGVTSVINEFGKVIVLEDDLVCHPKFLEYMNFCLVEYKENDLVMGVSGFSFINDVSISSCFLLPLSSAWGWATWSNRWNNLEFNSNKLITQVENLDRVNDFNFGGYDYFSMLKFLKNSPNDPWDIRVYANLFLNNKYYIFPNKTLIRNLGFDGTGVHCNNGGNEFDLEFEDFTINISDQNYSSKSIEVVKSVYLKTIEKTNSSNFFVKFKDKINYYFIFPIKKTIKKILLFFGLYKYVVKK